MKQLIVPQTPDLWQDSPISLVTAKLDALPRQGIASCPWSAEEGKPEVYFTLAHNDGCLFLKYRVREKTLLARYRNINDPVYKDSCVEFFIAYGEDSAYYNIEANCLGTCLVGYGKGKNNRKLLPTETVSVIRHHADLKVANKGQSFMVWELTLIIPASVFSEHKLKTFEGQNGRVNFYKCGDDLPEPHYLAWHPIEAPEPDFHRPEYFGQIAFIGALLPAQPLLHQ
ncbi:cellulose/xylan binding protein with CBM9 domain [Pontibacter ummariensis]|uniref:Carbohydrate-binding family 9 n=1 Tax=Pontibacter ummariensis TaxID=1610492 RepID=A0A239LXS7_9BACT|nr:carbohydrate-binding family 9-like protein [Pontibacter ummariensis]PRY00216.1 cellulose/xylan binding protein with CBM9 domain [Pontibacter ummariensis]SNT34678.1 Carbohydrate-binding family 9 [Pontibacter ummariensis]